MACMACNWNNVAVNQALPIQITCKSYQSFIFKAVKFLQINSVICQCKIHIDKENRNLPLGLLPVAGMEDFFGKFFFLIIETNY